jgi:protein involved in polysaccharide export with SLBB domain
MSQNNNNLSLRVLYRAVVAAVILFPGLANGQQPLTAEQVELLRSLPESQQRELMQRFAAMPGANVEPGLVFPVVVNRRPAAAGDELPADRISGGETLIVNFTLRDDLDAETLRRVRNDANRVALLGSNAYELDAGGSLRLPGVATVPLLGLDEREIRIRLGAEPNLRELTVEVVMLPAMPEGIATLRRFGGELFDGAPTTFAPATDVPVPADYVVGPGDRINLQLFGNENADYSLVIGRDGVIGIPDIGPMGTAGLTFAELRDEIVRRVSEQMIGVRASVTIAELRSIRVFVLGDVRTPGSFTVSGLSTMTNALFVSGGIAESGTLRDVQLKRAGKIVGRLDLYDLLLRGDTSGDRRLQPGDVIFVPPVGVTVGVSGEILRPAIYEARGEKSLGEIIGMAGGFRPTAYRPSGQLERIDGEGRRTIITLNLADNASLATPVRDGDLLHVDVVLDELEDSVLLGGHVLRPGPFQWRPGLRLADIIRAPAALKAQADLGYVLIRRELPESGELAVLSADLELAWREPGSADNLRLRPRDRVTVFELGPSRGAAVYELLQELTAQARLDEPFQEVSISGQVKAAGTYPLEDGMHLSDLLRAGGGLSEAAFTGQAELTRYIVGEDGQRRSVLIEIDLERALVGDAEADIALTAHDHVNVREVPQWRDKEIVTIRGEVRFPGIYTLRRGETLRSVIERAGGLTDRAFPQGAVFTREALRERERQQIQVLADRLESDLASLALRESRESDGQTLQALSVGQSLLAQLRTTEPVGRLVIDLEAHARAGSDAVADLLLRDGDRLLVPEQSQEVTVIGEVQYPTSHLHGADLTREDYISSSGGLTVKADRKRIYVVRADGSVLVDADSRFFRSGGGAGIRPGDTIVVPLDAERMSPIAFWSNVTQVVFNLAVAVAAVNSF